jgi:RimJ/RimL family protein N-acetyltransferase
MARIVVSDEIVAIDWPLSSLDLHTRRLALKFDIGQVTFSTFQEADTLDLLEIRNDVAVLPFMPAQEHVPFERHRLWVRSNLLAVNASTPLLFVGRMGRRPAGFGVIKPTIENAVVEIGVMVTGTWQRSGLPARLAAALVVVADRLLGTREVLTYVHQSHIQALRFNRAWGMREVPSNKIGEVCFRAAIEQPLGTSLCQRCIRDLELQVSKFRC